MHFICCYSRYRSKEIDAVCLSQRAHKRSNRSGKSCHEYVDCACHSQWYVLPYTDIKNLSFYSGDHWIGDIGRLF